MEYLAVALIIGATIGIPGIVILIVLACLSMLLWSAWDTGRLERNMGKPARTERPWWWWV